MQDSTSVDVAIIGGGIIGLTFAYKLKNLNPSCEIVVFEKEQFLGEHSSGRNSGVLHAGIYYPQNSLKHLLCLDGNQQWDKISSDLSISIKRCGKLIFSTTRREEAKLEELFDKAKNNDVPINWASKEELASLQGFVHATQALSSPSTGILDVSDAIEKIKYNLESRNVHLFTSHQVDSISRSNNGFVIKLSNYEVTTQKVINCAGLGAVDLRRNLGLEDIENYFVRGNYLSTNQKLPYPTLFYPIPPEDLKGLGVHSTIDLNGKVKFGPNTEDVTMVDYSPPTHDLKEMKSLVMHYFKNIDETKLYWDYAGCRSKIRSTLNGSLLTDFWIKSPLENYIECLGIESPGVTSAPAIADYILANYLR